MLKIQDLLSSNDIAKAIGVSIQTVHNWSQNGKLVKPIRIGGRCFWTREDFEALQESMWQQRN